MGYALGAAVTILVYMIAPFGETGLTMMALPLGFFTSGVYGSVGAILAELFPTLLSAPNGQGFTYNFGRGFRRGPFRSLVGGLSTAMSLGRCYRGVRVRGLCRRGARGLSDGVREKQPIVTMQQKRLIRGRPVR